MREQPVRDDHEGLHKYIRFISGLASTGRERRERKPYQWEQNTDGEGSRRPGRLLEAHDAGVHLCPEAIDYIPIETDKSRQELKAKGKQEETRGQICG